MKRKMWNILNSKGEFIGALEAETPDEALAKSFGYDKAKAVFVGEETLEPEPVWTPQTAAAWREQEKSEGLNSLDPSDAV